MKYLTKTVLAYASAVFAAGFVFFVFYAQASFNEQINYQGKLANSSSVAVPDGSYCMKFRIMDALTDGNELWSEIWTAANAKVSTTSGLFSVLLGSHTAFTDIFDSASLYLEVQLDAACDAVYEEIFSPRKQMGAVPAALQAEELAGATWAAPGTIGSTTPNTGAFTSLSATGSVTAGDMQITGTGTFGAVTTTGSGRFDAGLGVGVAPAASKGLSVTLTADELGELIYGSYNTIASTGSSTPASAYGIGNFITIGRGTSSIGAGTWNEITNNATDGNGVAYGTYSLMIPTAAGNTIYGEYIANATAITNPSANQIGLYLAWNGTGTDSSNLKWALYNASTSTVGGKVFLGLDNVKTYFGTGFDASIYYDGTNLVIDTSEVGTGVLSLADNGLTTTGAISGGAITGTSFIIGANTLTTTEWAFLDGQDQSVFTTSSPSFVNITATGTATLGNATSDIHGINTAAVANQMLTASYAQATADTSATGFSLTLAHSSSLNNADIIGYGYSLAFTISGTETGTGAPETRSSRGFYADINDNATLNSASSIIHNTYGVYSDVNFGGTNTDNQGLHLYGGYFTSTGNMGTTGNTDHYGLYSIVSGTADTNYGIYLDSSGATTNYSLYVNAGNVFLGGDSILTYQGTANDVSINYTGTNWDFDIAATTTAIRFNQAQFDTDFIVYGDTAAIMTLDAGTLEAAFGGLISSTATDSTALRFSTAATGTMTTMGRANDGTSFFADDADWTGAAYVARDTAASMIVMSGGSLYLRTNASLTSGNTFTTINRLTIGSTGNITFGGGVAGYDQLLTFDGETNNGVITWMEDEDYFLFSDNFALGTAADNNTFSTATHGTGSTTMYIGNSTINVTAPSDIRTKENIASTEYGIDTLMALAVRDFTYRKEYVDEGAKQEEHTGLVAQEVETVYPEAIIYRSDDLKAIDYNKLIPLLIKSVQDIKTQLAGNNVQLDQSGVLGTGQISGVSDSSISQALTNLGMSIIDGAATLKEIIADKLIVKTARIDKLEMVDSTTGEVYCTRIANGEWQKTKGECGSAEIIEAVPETAEAPATESQTIETETPPAESTTEEAPPAQTEQMPQETQETPEQTPETTPETEQEIEQPQETTQQPEEPQQEAQPVEEPPAEVEQPTDIEQLVVEEQSAPVEESPPAEEAPSSVGEIIQEAAAALLNGMLEFIKWVLELSLSAVSRFIPDNIEKSSASLVSSGAQYIKSDVLQVFLQASQIKNLFKK